MSEERKISEEMRNAFVDGQLDASEWGSITPHLERDVALREQVCELRTLKDMVRRAYAVPPMPRERPRRAAGPGWKTLAAASVAFAVLGWFGHAWWGAAPALDPASAYALRGDWHAPCSSGPHASCSRLHRPIPHRSQRPRTPSGSRCR